MAGGGGGQPAGYAVTTGPTIQAANAAAQAQIAATQQAAQVASQNTNAAISSLMNQYSTALQYAGPSINTGNQAMAQLNYMLGLPAVSPGDAPTAPTQPTLQSVEDKLSRSDVNNYILQNSSITGVDNVFGQTFGHEAYYGAGVDDPALQSQFAWNPTPHGEVQPGYGLTMEANTGEVGSALGAFAGNPGIVSAAKGDIAQQQLNQYLMPQYEQQLQAYKQQKAQYDQQEATYQDYLAKGVATPDQISNIVTNIPGYQFNMKQGVSGVQNAASANGLLNSGQLLRQLDEFGQGLASSYYNTYMGQLAGLAGIGQQATGLAQQGAGQLGSNVANAQIGLGNTLANSYLAAGQAQASAYLSPAANQQTIATPYGSQGGGGGGLGSAMGLLGSVGSMFGGGGGGMLGGLFSSSKLKDKVETVSTKDILKNVKSLEIDRWKYKDINETHLGPYAEQFKELFKVGDGQSINIIDMFGVLFATVKELSHQIETLKVENARR